MTPIPVLKLNNPQGVAPPKYISVPTQVTIQVPATRSVAPAPAAPPVNPIAAQPTPQVIANQNPTALAAMYAGQSTYQTPNGGTAPTVTISGAVRNTYGDAANGIGSNKSLTSS